MQSRRRPCCLLPESAAALCEKKENGMKKLPTFVKWLLVAAALAAMAGMMWLVNDRAARVEMPAPDNIFGIYRQAE